MYNLHRYALLKKSYAIHKGSNGHRLETRRRQLRKNPIRLHKTVQRVCPALNHAEAAAKVVLRSFVSVKLLRTRQKASRDGFDWRERVGKLVPKNPDEPLPRGLLFFAQRLAYVGQQQQSVRRTLLPKGGFAQEPAIGPVAKGMPALIRRGKQALKPKLLRGTAEASGMRNAQQLHARFVDELKHVLAVEGIERRVHDLKDASQ